MGRADAEHPLRGRAHSAVRHAGVERQAARVIPGAAVPADRTRERRSGALDRAELAVHPVARVAGRRQAPEMLVDEREARRARLGVERVPVAAAVGGRHRRSQGGRQERERAEQRGRGRLAQRERGADEVEDAPAPRQPGPGEIEERIRPARASRARAAPAPESGPRASCCRRRSARGRRGRRRPRARRSPTSRRRRSGSRRASARRGRRCAPRAARSAPRAGDPPPRRACPTRARSRRRVRPAASAARQPAFAIQPR